MMQGCSIKRVIFLLLTVFLLASFGGCQYEVKRHQYSFAVRTKNIDDASLLRAAVKSFAKSEGFAKETQADNEAHLEKSGMYLLSFYSDDKSFISLSNIVDRQCYDVAVYSSVSASAADALGTRLSHVLGRVKAGELRVEQSGCGAGSAKSAGESSSPIH